MQYDAFDNLARLIQLNIENNPMQSSTLMREIVEFEMGMELRCRVAEARPVSDPLETYAGSFGVTARSENRSRSHAIRSEYFGGWSRSPLPRKIPRARRRHHRHPDNQANHKILAPGTRPMSEGACPGCHSVGRNRTARIKHRFADGIGDCARIRRIAVNEDGLDRHIDRSAVYGVDLSDFQQLTNSACDMIGLVKQRSGLASLHGNAVPRISSIREK
jgi:hypothetical protein